MLKTKSILTIVLTLVLHGCGSGNTEDANDNSDNGSNNQDSETADSSSSPTYTDANGLEWALCAVGQQYDESSHSCTGDATPVNFCEGGIATACTGGEAGAELDGNGTSGVYDACDSFDHNGQRDWRVPAKLELDGLYHGGYTNNTSVLPRANHVFWSATSFPTDETKAWRYDFADGYMNYFPAERYYSVRCARDAN